MATLRENFGNHRFFPQEIESSQNETKRKGLHATANKRAREPVNEPEKSTPRKKRL